MLRKSHPTSLSPSPAANVSAGRKQQPTAPSSNVSVTRFTVNDVRSELQGATCQIASSRASTDFDCSAPLPALSAGTSRIELATFIIDGQVFESARSAPLLVSKIGAEIGSTRRTAASKMAERSDLHDVRRPALAAGTPSARSRSTHRHRICARRSSAHRRRVGPGRRPDAGRPRSVTRGRCRWRAGGAGTTRLLSLAVDPNFDRTRSVYAVYTTAAPNGSRVFALSRFSEASNALFGEVVLLDRIPASAAAAASVRMSADGKLFVAFDDGGDPRRAGDLASPSGKLLRLNPDGTTPDDQAGLTPTYAADFHSPRGFDWQPGSRVLWIADHLTDDAASLTGVASTPGAQRRGVRVASYSLPRESRPSAAAFIRNSSLTGFDNDLLIASAEGRHLLRVRFDAAAGTRAVATERLLQDVVGAVRVVAVGPDGAVYIATDDAVAQITMAE